MRPPHAVEEPGERPERVQGRPVEADRPAATPAAAPAKPTQMLALQQSAGNRAVAAGLARDRAAGRAAPPARPSVQRQGAGPLSFLGPVQSAPPSALGSALAAATSAAPAALEAGRAELSGQLPAGPAPTGLPPGPAAELPELAGLGGAGAAGAPAVRDEPGAADPAQAERLAASGATSIAAAASATVVPVPDPAAIVHPELSAGRLAPPTLAAAAALPGPGAVPTAVDDEKVALDATMGPEVETSLTSILAPARASDAAYGRAATSIGTGAKTQVATAATSTRSQQQAALAGTGAQVTGLHAEWSGQKAAVAEEHRAAISADAARTRTDATRTLAEADAKAADEKARAQREDSGGGGLWGRVKAAGSAVVGAVKSVASSVWAGITAIVNAARDRVKGMLGGLLQAVRARVAAAVKALADGARRVAGAIAAAVRRARDLVTRLAHAVRDLAVRVWQAAADRLSRLWQSLRAAAEAAIRAARNLLAKVANALALVKQILKLLGNKLLGFIIEAVQDPQGKIVAPIVAKAAPMTGGVPGKADELAHQSAGPGAAGAAGPTAQRAAVQRQAVAPAPVGETFWSGVGRHLRAAGANFLDNWASILGKVIIDVLLWVPMIVQEGPKLWAEIKGIFSGGGGVDRLDHALGALRHLVNIVGGTLATVGVWALIIALAGGPVAEGVVLGVYETASLTVIGVDLALAAAELSKDAYSATRPGIDGGTRDRYLGMFAGSGIAAAITVVLVALGVLASRLAKAFKASRAAGAAEAAEGGKTSAPVEENAPAPVEDKAPAPVEEPKPAEQVEPGKTEEPPAEDSESGQVEADKAYAACFLAGTLVVAGRGAVVVESLSTADLVWSRRPGAEPVRLTGIADTFTGSAVRVRRITVGRASVLATRRHRFSVLGTGWVAAQDLVPGSVLETASGAGVPVSAVAEVAYAAAQPTYNLTVPATSTYLVRVGEHDVLVHNGKTPPTPPNFDRVLYWVFGKKAVVRPTDTDGKSLWKTTSKADVDKMMEARVNGDGRPVDDPHAFYEPKQLEDAGIVLPETAGEGAVAATGLSHHSARPASTPDPSLPLDAEALEGLQKSLDAAGAPTVVKPKALKGTCG
ncbi:MAG: hypothetical protein V7637_1808 [Mycobacteriales bacterium]